MRKKAILFAVFILLVAGIDRSVSAGGFDHLKFNRVLKTYVNPQGLVDYNGIAADQSFKMYMKDWSAAMPL